MTHTMRNPVRHAVVVALLAGLMTAVPAIAQNDDASKSTAGDASAQQQAAPSGAMMKSRLEVRKLRKQLGEIRNAALENNPELQKKRKELESSVNEAISENGVDPKKDMERLREIAGKLRSGDVKGEEQKALTQEYRTKRQALLKARRKALAKDEVQKRRKAFQNQLLTAMKSENQNTDELIDKYNKARMQLRQQMRDSAGDQGKKQDQDQ